MKEIRVGNGFDVHKLSDGKKIRLKDAFYALYTLIINICLILIVL